jgi:hypothetical protein
MRAFAAAALVMLVAGPGLSQPGGGTRPMLERLETGQWELRGGAGNPSLSADGLSR